MTVIEIYTKGGLKSYRDRAEELKEQIEVKEEQKIYRRKQLDIVLEVANKKFDIPLFVGRGRNPGVVRERLIEGVTHFSY